MHLQYALVGLLASAFGHTGALQIGANGKNALGDAPDSPRLAAVDNELKLGNKSALEKFWQDMKGKAPLVEAIPGGNGDFFVTYLWRGDKNTTHVHMIGGLPSSGPKPLARFLDTDLWHHTERMPKDARYSYGFLVNWARGKPAKLQNDPLGAKIYAEQSVVELPGAPPQTWSEKIDGVPEGKLETFKVKSDFLKFDRAITVYTPSGYDPKRADNGLLIVFDGESCGGDLEGFNPIPGHIILDNLIATKGIAPMVAVFVESGNTRDRDLGCYPPFVNFLAKELVPWIRARYKVTADPTRVVVSGFSRGGLGAAYCAFKHPELFGNVLTQSGAFWWHPDADSDALLPSKLRTRKALDREPGWLTRQIVASPKLPVRFYIEAGKFEEVILSESRRLHDVLQAKGHSVIYREFTGDHDYITWRGSFADGLLALIAKKSDQP
ncbi:MAG: DUF3327 domain-containing protein [Planctomycetes bacterium]|nr:DUF3327 domain-containing protein [Planctomycetota bacterium]